MEATAKSSIMLAALDLGSNSFRLLVGRWDGNRFKPQVKELDIVGLGRGLSSHGNLSPAAIAAGLQVLSSYRRIINAHKVAKIRICATQALRVAQNSDDFIRQAKEIIAAEIEIISGEEEAALSLAGARYGQPSDQQAVILADVGGASTELIFAEPSAKTQMLSLAIGAVVLTEAEAIGSNDQLLYANRVRLAHFFTSLPEQTTLIGVGGTATTLAMLDLGLQKYDAERVHGHILAFVKVRKIYGKLAALSLTKRRQLPGLEAGRADIIVAGVMIYLAIMDALQIERLQVSDSGILEGIILTMIQRSGG